MGVGGRDGQIKIFDIKTGQMATIIETEGPIQSLGFSENGTWLASASQGSTSVTIWHLAKTPPAKLREIEFGAAVSDIAWDYTGQYLAIVGGGSIAVHSYQKSGKKWSELIQKAMQCRKVAWDPQGQHLLVDSEKGIAELSA
jgi:pre-mRNA-processing factor 19